MRGLLAACCLPLLAACSSGPITPLSEKRTHVLEAHGDDVLLVHGLRWWSLGGLDGFARRLHAAGYRVIQVEYPSREIGCKEIIHRHVATAIREHHHGDRPLHIIAHSMGAPLVHCLLQEERPRMLGRVVFIGTPHAGTAIADITQRGDLAKKIAGPAASMLNTGAGALHTRLEAPRFHLGIIMGDRSSYPFLSPFIPGDDDGAVPVAGGRIAGARDFLVMHEGHMDLIRSAETLRQIRHFIEHGVFDHSQPPPRNARLGKRTLLAVPGR
jgi:triacylglycerol lipase